MAIQVKTLDQLKTMRRAGLVVAEIHKAIREAIKPGMTTSALDTIAEAVIKRHGATYCGAIVDGWHGDAAFSVGIGVVDPEDQKLMDVCEESMWRGIAAGKNGAKLSDIGYAIEQYTNSQGKYGILQEYGGHGIGTEMHQEPHVLNFGKAGNGPEIIPGFVLAIEPMITRGSARTKVLGDDWTVVSVDKSRGSHFEHTYAILPDGKPFVLTAFDGGKAELARLGVTVSDLL
jgi:methionyl aminopeptidase